MRFFGKFIKKKYNSKTDSDVIFSLSSAYLTIESKMGLKNSGRCALSLKSISGMYFNEMKDDIKRFLDISKTDFELTYRTVIDSYGYLWVILEGKRMEDLLAGISAVGDTVDEKGFSNQLHPVTNLSFLQEGHSHTQHNPYPAWAYNVRLHI